MLNVYFHTFENCSKVGIPQYFKPNYSHWVKILSKGLQRILMLTHSPCLSSFRDAVLPQNPHGPNHPNGHHGPAGVRRRRSPLAPDRLAEGRRHRLPRRPGTSDACDAGRRHLFHHQREDGGHGRVQLHGSERRWQPVSQRHPDCPG